MFKMVKFYAMSILSQLQSKTKQKTESKPLRDLDPVLATFVSPAPKTHQLRAVTAELANLCSGMV